MYIHENITHIYIRTSSLRYINKKINIYLYIYIYIYIYTNHLPYSPNFRYFLISYDNNKPIHPQKSQQDVGPIDRQLGGDVVHAVSHADASEQLCRPLPTGGVGADASEQHWQLHVFNRCEAGQKVEGLEDKPDAAQAAEAGGRG